MAQCVVICRACQRSFLVSTVNLDQLEAECPICGLTLISPTRSYQTANPPTEITPWDPSWSDCG